MFTLFNTSNGAYSQKKNKQKKKGNANTFKI